MGERAERFVEERLRAALPDEARLYANVRSRREDAVRGTGARRRGRHRHRPSRLRPARDRGQVGRAAPRCAAARWFIGGHRAADARRSSRPRPRSTTSSERSRHCRTGRPAATSGPATRSRFPTSTSRASPRGHVLLGPDANRDIILDADAFATPAPRAAPSSGPATAGSATAPAATALAGPRSRSIDEFLAPTVELRRLLRHDIEEGRTRLLAGLERPASVLNQNRTRRRAEVVGPAGSGKSLVAVEKACRLAREGWRTLFVCFNQPLATAVLREVEARRRARGSPAGT